MTNLINLIKEKMFDSKGRFCSPRCKISYIEKEFPDYVDYFNDQLKHGKSPSQIIFNVVNGITDSPTCRYCSNLAWYKSFQSGYSKTCGKQECLRKGYGENPHIPTEKERAAHSIRMKESNPMFNREIAKKVSSSHISKYGYLAFHSVESKERALDSRFDRFGTFSPKSKLFKTKDYKMPNGDVVKIQGYEFMALDLLVGTGEDIVICGKSHKFRYEFEGKIRTYYPDIFLPHKNLYIEVKCPYTFDSKEKQNLAKKASVLAREFNFEFWVFDKDRNLIIK